jgi:hypothetical protein
LTGLPAKCMFPSARSKYKYIHWKRIFVLNKK